MDIPNTWGEFKAYVETQGVKDEDTITYIDWIGGDHEPDVVWGPGEERRCYIE